MLPEVEKLLRVQHHDQNISAIDKELQGIPLLQEDVRNKLSEDEEAMEAAKQAFQKTEIAIKNLEIDIETRKDSIAKLKVQQFETKKNEEFQRMGTEIEKYGEDISALEDQEIELMEQAETEKEAYDAAKAAVAETASDVESELEDLEDLAKNLKANRIEEVEARAKQAEALEDDLLYNYDRLFKAKAGQAVVGLVDGACQGCHMRVTKSTVVDVKNEKQIATCENCGRILYWWTDASVGKDMGEY